eukprot:gene18490-20339_t
MAQHWNMTRLNFVADRHPFLSIKNTERTRRAQQGVQKIKIFCKEQKVPKQWKKYMSCGENKEFLHNILKELFMMTGTGNNFRCIPIKPITGVLGENLCKSLPGFHAFTGCDSNSWFFGKGKAKAWKMLEKYPQFIESFSSLRHTFPPAENLIKEWNKYVCLLYGDVVSENVHDSEFPIPPAVGNRWEISDDTLNVVWMTKLPAPGSLLDFVSCKYKTGYKSQRCSCLKSSVKCTDLCLCISCQNCAIEKTEVNLEATNYSEMDEEELDSDLDLF